MLSVTRVGTVGVDAATRAAAAGAGALPTLDMLAKPGGWCSKCNKPLVSERLRRVSRFGLRLKYV